MNHVMRMEIMKALGNISSNSKHPCERKRSIFLSRAEIKIEKLNQINEKMPKEKKKKADLILGLGPKSQT